MDIAAQLLELPSVYPSSGSRPPPSRTSTRSRRRQAKSRLIKSDKPFWQLKEERLAAEIASRRMRGEVLAQLVKCANPAKEPGSAVALAYEFQRGLSVTRATGVTANLQMYPHDPDALAAFRVNVKDVAATRPYLVVPPHTAPRRHRTPVGAQSVEEEEDTGLPRFEFAASFWAVREDESDARDFYDTEDVFRRRLAVDWKRCVAKERFKDFLVKEDKRACEERGRREALAAEGKLWDAASVGGGKDSLRQRTQSQVVGKKNEGHDLLLQEKANPSLLDHLNARELTAMKKLLEKQDLEKLEMEARQHEGIVPLNPKS